MYILAIETTGAFASVALANAEWKNSKVTSFEILGHIDGNDKFSHLQNLTPQIQQILEESGSTARALSQVLNIPCAAVSSLEAMALRQFWDGDREESRNVSEETVVCPIIDARRSQVYGGGFKAAEEVIPCGPYTVEEFMDAILAKGITEVLFMGDGIDKYQSLIEDLHRDKEMDSCSIRYADAPVRYQDADTVAYLGAKAAAAGKLCGFEQLKPNYMRMAEAERKLKEKQKNG